MVCGTHEMMKLSRTYNAAICVEVSFVANLKQLEVGFHRYRKFECPYINNTHVVLTHSNICHSFLSSTDFS